MDTKRFTIYFTSDLHGYIYPTDYRSRQERNIGLFKCASQFHKDGNTLVIDGGDILQGSPLGAYCHDTLGDASRFAEIMNRCGYDYVTLGNHDFNYGMDYLDSYLNALHARCVCENVRWDGARVRFPARIHTLENGLRIGIVGIVTDYVNIWEKPEHLSGITISDPIPAARAALESLRGRVDVTLCIYHGGFERDLATGRVLSTTHENVAYRLCQELDFDLLLTGHQHMTVHGQTLCGTFVVQPTDRGQEFLHIEAAISETGKRFTSETIPASGACRREWLDEFAGMERGAQDWLDQVVGHLPQPLLPDTPLHMALIASTIANRGVMNEPRLIAQVTTAQGGNRALLSHAGGRRVISEDVANRLESEMIRVVKSGTGKRAALDNGYTVAGKTGSAEASNDKSIESHAWFVGYITNDNAPYAVCVLVENGGSGGGVAAPLARKTLQKAINLEL